MRARKDDSVVIKTVSENVRALRISARLSQEELAHRAGLDRTYVSQVERMRRNMTIVVLARIAVALDVTPDKLLAGWSRNPRKRGGD
jgi:transcriptional regulator with XRE-family HTH domain